MSTTVAINIVDISKLTNEDLIRRMEDLAADVRAKTSDLIESLVELDRRKLYLKFRPSLFEYCVLELRMSDAAAYRRIRAARAIETYPAVGPLLRCGKLSLESVALLSPFLNDADAGALVAQASGLRVWEVDRLVAGRRTEAPRRDIVRFVPAAALAPAEPLEPNPDNEEPSLQFASPDRRPAADALAPSVPVLPPNPAPAKPRPASAAGVRIGFTADQEFFKLLREVQAAMRHKYPNGRLDGIFRDALQALLRKKRPWAFPAKKR